jgi:hypothetical protein
VQDLRAHQAMLVVSEKVSKLIKMLSSPVDAEVVAAARALVRTLQADGSDIHALAERVEGRKLSQAEMQIIYDKAFQDGKNAAVMANGFHPVDVPTFYAMACEIQHKAGGRLSPKEEEFVEDMVRWCARREPSEKQAKWLHSLYCRIGRQ